MYAKCLKQVLEKPASKLLYKTEAIRKHMHLHNLGNKSGDKDSVQACIKKKLSPLTLCSDKKVKSKCLNGQCPSCGPQKQKIYYIRIRRYHCTNGNTLLKVRKKV